jgi:hypothetical protein
MNTKHWERKETIVNRFAYVSVSRASQDAHIFTNNFAQLAPQPSTDISKTSALKVAQSAAARNVNFDHDGDLL